MGTMVPAYAMPILYQSCIPRSLDSGTGCSFIDSVHTTVACAQRNTLADTGLAYQLVPSLCVYALYT